MYIGHVYHLSSEEAEKCMYPVPCTVNLKMEDSSASNLTSFYLSLTAVIGVMTRDSCSLHM